MGLKSLFHKYILPESIDFVQALQQQSSGTNAVIADLYRCFIHLDADACEMILNDEHAVEAIKDKNMHDLLNAFITPIDRESIYRAVTGLNWIVLSIKHFVLETKAYKIDDLNRYEKLLKLITEAGQALNSGFEALGRNNQDDVANLAEQARLAYDGIVNLYVLEMAGLLEEENSRTVFVDKEILSQLREIGKRIYITANTLQDIVVKMD